MFQFLQTLCKAMLLSYICQTKGQKYDSCSHNFGQSSDVSIKKESLFIPSIAPTGSQYKLKGNFFCAVNPLLSLTLGEMVMKLI